MALRKIFLPAILFLLAGLHGFAAGGRLPALSHDGDSLLPVSIRHIQQEELASDLLEAEADYDRTQDDRKGLVRLLRVINVKRLITDSRRGYRLFTNLAKFSARLKLYPLAMKFYNRAGEYRKNTLMAWYQSPLFADPALAGADSDWETPLADSSMYTWLHNMDSLSSLTASRETRSLPVEMKDLRKSFEDGRTGVSYALILHTKQPIPGRRRSYTHINNVGHMFITLIKYNADNSFTARSFGFYPHKKNVFSATPLHVRAPSVFKDDALHDWDESIGKFISAARFEKILDLLGKYDHAVYNLNRNNCTDFGLDIASLVGISIADTRGTWPLGRGNNPANAGQSLLEGKFRDTDGDRQDALFVCKKGSLDRLP